VPTATSSVPTHYASSCLDGTPLNSTRQRWWNWRAFVGTALWFARHGFVQQAYIVFTAYIVLDVVWLCYVPTYTEIVLGMLLISAISALVANGQQARGSGVAKS